MTDVSNPGRQPALKLGNGELILVVDDERSIRELLQMFFVSRGYNVLAGADGNEGFLLLRDNHAKVRLVVTDYNMPVVNGKQLLLLIREFYPEIPVLFCAAVTGERMACQLDEFGRLPGVKFLPKPFTLATLSAHVQALLAKQAPSPVDS